MISKLQSAVLFGAEAIPVEVEVDVSGQFPSFVLVGLPDTSLKESRDRVKSAIINSQYSFPHTQKITVNLAPADIRKEGAMYDLPIALGILESSGQIPQGKSREYGFLGELSLDGKVRPVRGAILAVLSLKQQEIRKILLPRENVLEASLVEGVSLYPISTLREAAEFLSGEKSLSPFQKQRSSPPSTSQGICLSQVVGHALAKRALLIAAAGGHNLLLFGPPGGGKTMLAKCLPTLLPPMNEREILEVTALYSLAGLLDREKGMVTTRPFRSPHHTISDAGLIGGGCLPKPGEISLSHRGVLFLDELPEFSRRVLEVLRQPLEEGLIRIGRVQRSVVYPAKFLFVGAMNPCPCGYFSQQNGKSCRCSLHSVRRYLRRLSGPLLDRIDLHIFVEKTSLSQLLEADSSRLSSSTLQEKVKKLWELQKERFQKEGIEKNGEMSSAQVEKYCSLDRETKQLLKSAERTLHLSTRSYFKILKVSRTIADLEGASHIRVEHVAEALQYRQEDKLWL